MCTVEGEPRYQKIKAIGEGAECVNLAPVPFNKTRRLAVKGQKNGELLDFETVIRRACPRRLVTGGAAATYQEE